MFPAADGQPRSTAAGCGLPKAGLGSQLADVGQRYFQRPIGEHPPRLVRRDRQDQFKILAVAQGVIQGCRAVGQLVRQPPGIIGERNVLGIDNRPAAAFLHEAGQIEREAVADIDAGVQLVGLVQSERLADPRLEVEMAPEDAAAEEAGDEDPVAGPRPARVATGRVRQPRPRTVTLTASGPSQLLVSPPAMATSYCSASGSMPS